MSSTTCPGCDGTKSKDAQLCRECRTRANAIGASVVVQIPQVAAPVHPTRQELRTSVQNRIYHGRLTDLARYERKSVPAAKREVLAWASRRFGRTITSSTELTEIEMELLLEHLETLLEPYKAAEGESP